MLVFIMSFAGSMWHPDKALAATLTASNSQIQSAKWSWVDEDTISGTINGQTITLQDGVPLDHYWNSATGKNSPQSGGYNYVTQGNTCDHQSQIWADPYYTTKGEPYFHAKVWADEPGTTGDTCREVDINVGHVTISNKNNANIMFKFSGNNIVRIDGNSTYTFQPSSFKNVYTISGASTITCPDSILYNPSAGDAMGNGTVYGMNQGASGSKPPSSLHAGSSCNIDPGETVTDVTYSNQGLLSGCTWFGGSGTCSETAEINNNGTVNLHIGGSPSQTPSGGGGGTGSGSGSSSTSPQLQCTISIINPLTWLVCPIISAAEGFVGQLDSAINDLLNVDVSNYLDQNNSNQCSTNGSSNPQPNCSYGASFYTAWNTMRLFALTLIVIVALVMIIAQAIGVEAVSAYSIRKILPRLLIAIIAITLSWDIIKFVLQLTDDIGHGIADIIYAPFPDAITKINDGAISGLAIVGAGGLLVLGIVGALSFVLTAAIAVLTGFAFLVIRKILILLFIILAPIAIACAILPNTQKAWKMWSDSFLRLLIMFPLIAGFIAIGRVFAVVVSGGGSGLEDDIIKLVAWFAPYFMIPATFKMAGGIMSTVGNMASTISSKANQPFAGYRKRVASGNLQRMRTGDRFQSRNALTRAINRTTAGTALGWRGHFGIGRRGRGGLDTMRRAAAREATQENHQLQQLAFDDNGIGVLALSGGTRAGADRASRQLQTSLGWSDETRQQAVEAAAAVGFNDTNAAAALDIMAQNKSRVLRGDLAGDAGMDLVRQSATSISHGNRGLQENLMGSFAFNSRGAGRLDLGGEVAGESRMIGWQRASTQQHAQAFGASTQAYADAFVDTMRTGTGNERRASAVALAEMQSMLPYSTGENQTIINNAMASLGVRHNLTRTVRTPRLDEHNRQLADNNGNPIYDTRDVSVSVEEQLANLASGRALDAAPAAGGVISSAEIHGLARKYGSDIPYADRGATPAAPTPPPTGAGP